MAAICAAVYVVGVATCGCFPLAFFNSGCWLGACAVVGMGTFRSKYIMGHSVHTSLVCKLNNAGRVRGSELELRSWTRTRLGLVQGLRVRHGMNILAGRGPMLCTAETSP